MLVGGQASRQVRPTRAARRTGRPSTRAGDARTIDDAAVVFAALVAEHRNPAGHLDVPGGVERFEGCRGHRIRRKRVRLYPVYWMIGYKNNILVGSDPTLAEYGIHVHSFGSRIDELPPDSDRKQRRVGHTRSGVGDEPVEAVNAVGLEWLRPSGKLLVMRRVEVLVTAVAVAVAAGVIGALVSTATTGVIAASIAVAAGLVAERFLRRRVRAWAYCEREEDLLVRRGVLFSRLSVIPYGRMQFIDVTAGPVERLFKLATVRMHTAAAASDARIPGLAQSEAARLRDRLAALGEAQAAGL